VYDRHGLEQHRLEMAWSAILRVTGRRTGNASIEYGYGPVSKRLRFSKSRSAARKKPGCSRSDGGIETILPENMLEMYKVHHRLVAVADFVVIRLSSKKIHLMNILYKQI
jgi:hypothetical protein